MMEGLLRSWWKLNRQRAPKIWFEVRVFMCRRERPVGCIFQKLRKQILARQAGGASIYCKTYKMVCEVFKYLLLPIVEWEFSAQRFSGKCFYWLHSTSIPLKIICKLDLEVFGPRLSWPRHTQDLLINKEWASLWGGQHTRILYLPLFFSLNKAWLSLQWEKRLRDLAVD